MRYRWAFGHACGAALPNTFVQLANDIADFISGRLRFILRWHFAGIDLFNDFSLDMAVEAGLEVAR